MTQDKKPIKTILTQKDGSTHVRFSPVLKNENAKEHLNNFLDAFPYALLNLLATFPMMRPATQEERDAHIYVFQSGSVGEQENKFYRGRKAFYDKLAALFSSILSIGFGDVEYIEACAKYQQNYTLDHSQEEYDIYLEEIKNITTYVREHYKEILNEVDKETSKVAE